MFIISVDWLNYNRELNTRIAYAFRIMLLYLSSHKAHHDNRFETWYYQRRDIDKIQ